MVRRLIKSACSIHPLPLPYYKSFRNLYTHDSLNVGDQETLALASLITLTSMETRGWKTGVSEYILNFL